MYRLGGTPRSVPTVGLYSGPDVAFVLGEVKCATKLMRGKWRWLNLPMRFSQNGIEARA